MGPGKLCIRTWKNVYQFNNILKQVLAKMALCIAEDAGIIKPYLMAKQDELPLWVWGGGVTAIVVYMRLKVCTLHNSEFLVRNKTRWRINKAWAHYNSYVAFSKILFAIFFLKKMFSLHVVSNFLRHYRFQNTNLIVSAGCF